MGQKAEGAVFRKLYARDKTIYLDFFIAVEYDNQERTATVYKALGEKACIRKRRRIPGAERTYGDVPPAPAGFPAHKDRCHVFYSIKGPVKMEKKPDEMKKEAPAPKDREVEKR